ncbi:MAG: metal-dependent hydrolase [Planctomycetaceae bacterium]|nr:metal-dependent hydrolase [Planctomycetaceae bacterium]
MKLHLLGTGGYHPNELRHTSCLMLPEQGIVLDAGTAFFRVPPRVQNKHLKVFLTHPHWDHIIGLTYVIVPLLTEQIDKITIYANRYTIEAVKKFLFAEPTFPHMPDFEIILLEDCESPIQIENCNISWHQLASHPGGSIGYRLETDQSSFCYISDTAVDGTYTDFVRGCDLLIHECYFLDDMQDWAEKTGHSFKSQVLELARDANAKQLLLTHIDPEQTGEDPLELAKGNSIFPNVSTAQDLMTVDLA